ncbi:MAG: hypothetical protein Q9222_005410 [Ikaeria aurantiellina]
MTHSSPDRAMQSPDGMLTSSFTPPRCCCGRDYCAYWKYNDAALRGLEDDLRRAAQAGQSLLARHEAYVLEATEERQRMAESIDRLERDKKELEAASATTIRENRSLLDQLEDLNKTVATSDTHVHSLTATLQSTRVELDRLNALAARASHLEAQISLMETEHAGLHEKLAASEEDQRSAIERWKDAERTIITLQEQINRIEAEARDESERHAEILSRFERREAVDQQLQSAAGRLKGAAATTALGKESHGKTNVVSHFVKDILADNASLQMGIMELREMLTSSNDEVQKLRQQMMAHQPIYPDQHSNSPPAPPEKSVGQTRVTEPDSMPALHVHHHYHEASKMGPPMRQRSARSRRSRVKRYPVTTGASTPMSGSETPRSPQSPRSNLMRARPPPSAATILSQTSVSIPAQTRDPYLIHSANARASIAPSSEFSSPHLSTFDFLSGDSRPTSPEDSFNPASPPFLPVRRKGDTSTSVRRSSSPVPRRLKDNPRPRPSKPLNQQIIGSTVPQQDSHGYYSTIPEGPENDPDQSNPNATNNGIFIPNPSLRRSASHESILSIAGIQSKQPRKQRSQLFRGAGLQSRTSLGPSSPTTSMVSSKPVISTAPIKITPSFEQQSRAGRAVSSGAMSTLSSSLAHTSSAETSTTIGKRVGGWVWGKWGMAPMASTGDLRGKANVHAKEDRPTGVNQKGSLRALRQAKRLSSHVEPVDVDEGLLKESLLEEG